MEREPIPEPGAPAPAPPTAAPAPSRARPALRLDAGQRLALEVAWRALWRSRALVWTAGFAGLLLLGRSSRWRGFDPGAVTAPFGPLGDALVAPGARWDSVWYLAVANDGYREPARTAFFPLYPLVLRATDWLVGPPLVAGLLVSLVALLVALYLLHRLVSLELDSETAAVTVALVAVFPAAYSLSAVYSESLFLALSVGAVYAARLDRWALAGLAGGLAALSRSTGIVLLVPLALLYLYGPRGPAAGLTAHRRRWRPGHPLRPDALWLALVPLGLGAFMAYLALTGADALAPFHAQAAWLRHFTGPFAGAWDGAVAAFDGARQLLSGARTPVYFTIAAGDPFAIGAQNLALFGSLLLAVAGIVGALRRLPPAYGGYLVAGLALPLSFPVVPQPLMSLPRYIGVLFPLHMWLALWTRERGWQRRAVVVSALLLALAAAQFTAWRWVA
jgi:hypothetical protein